MGTPGSASGLEKRTCGNTGTALQADSTGRATARPAHLDQRVGPLHPAAKMNRALHLFNADQEPGSASEVAARGDELNASYLIGKADDLV